MRISEVRVFRALGELQNLDDRFECRHEFFADADRERPHEAFFTEIVSEDGLVGFSLGGSRAIADLGRLIIGEDPRDIELIWEKLANSQYARYTNIHAMGVLDLALWDLNGKIRNEPVYRLLGGAVRTRIPAYAAMLGFSTKPELAAQRSAEMVAKGFDAVKWYVDANESSGRRGYTNIIALAASIREAVGPDIKIMLDFANADPTKNSVLYIAKIAQTLEKFNISWLEEPLHFDDLDAYKRLAALTRIPLACGEHVYTRWQIKRMLEDGSVQVFQPDMYFAAGLTEIRKMFNLISSFGATIIPHANESCIPTAHLAFTLPQRYCPMLEYGIKLNRRFQYFYEQPYVPNNGWFELPSGPGFGYRLDSTKILSKEYI